jgi:CO dehydrogenase/acetyl-CoA synthase beta subunit
MSNFEAYIREVRAYVEELRKRSAKVRVLHTSGAVASIRIGPGAGADLVLRRDTAVELGSPTTASCAIALYSTEPDSVHDSRVTLIGSDIAEAASASIPFGQVLIASGSALTEDDYETLLEAQYVSDFVEGYMVRSSSTHIWSRVSNEAVARGFNFATLGRAIEQHVKAQIPRVEAVEVVFVTTGDEDINHLARIATEAEQTGRDIRQRVWQQRGVDIFECTSGGHCGKCGDKAVCDRIRGMMGPNGSQDLTGEQAE